MGSSYRATEWRDMSFVDLLFLKTRENIYSLGRRSLGQHIVKCGLAAKRVILWVVDVKYEHPLTSRFFRKLLGFKRFFFNSKPGRNGLTWREGVGGACFFPAYKYDVRARWPLCEYGQWLHFLSVY